MFSISKLKKKLLPFISLSLQILLFFTHISCQASFPPAPPPFLCAFKKELKKFPQTNRNFLDFQQPPSLEKLQWNLVLLS
jgi:hypothetical protein